MNKQKKSHYLAQENLKRTHPIEPSHYRGSTMTNRMDFNRTHNGRQLGPSSASYFRTSRLKEAFTFTKVDANHMETVRAMKDQENDKKI